VVNGAVPVLIQGGMGMGVSSWSLARAVSQTGQLGVVSGVALDAMLARRLQDGDRDGSMRRALKHFPVQTIAERVRKRYFRPTGRAAGESYKPLPKLSLNPKREAQELSILGNFVEVWLARAGHSGLVGVNYMEKLQLATPFAAFGAMLAGVDYVLMGAGVPRQIPQMLDAIAAGHPGRISVDVHGATEEYTVSVDPVDLLGAELPPLRRPGLLAIVSSNMLALYLARDETIRPEGFIIEGPLAGGHNAPPRGKLQLDADHQPIYGPKDDADLEKIAALGLPFWLAGAYGRPERLIFALAAGAAGIQVGTLFALSRESGITEELRSQLFAQLADGGTPSVRTDALASPTGFPFKIATLTGTLAEQDVYEKRERLCDLSYLRQPFLQKNGEVGYRCASEPVHMFVRKGGDAEDAVGRVCLCNALTSTVGLGQTRKDGYAEPPLVTLGADVDGVRALYDAHPDGWSAADVVSWLGVEPRE
jgi:NAD(P)H-dependent flavin oxidoreductase YrpB (nitropropane dioxygenase family)